MVSPIISNLYLTALLVFSLVYTTWLIQLFIKDASIIDLIWGLGFGLAAAALLINSPQRTPYQMLLACLPILWAIRYTFFIWRRNFGKGEDPRYSQLRQRVSNKGQSWALFSFFLIYGFQAVSMLWVCLPLVIGMAAPESVSIGPLALTGALLWLVGFFFEAIADAQLNAFKAKNKDYQGPYEQKPLLQSGLWKYSRHPNYFGNACMWWGIGIIALAAPYGWIGLLGSAYMNFALVYLTGKANNESKMIKRPSYKDYQERTSGFVPWPPKKSR